MVTSGGAAASQMISASCASGGLDELQDISFAEEQQQLSNATELPPNNKNANRNKFLERQKLVAAGQSKKSHHGKALRNRPNTQMENNYGEDDDESSLVEEVPFFSPYSGEGVD